MARNSRGHGSAPRITPKLAQALDLLLSGQAKTITEAAAKSGFRRENVSRALQKPHVQAEIERRVRQRFGTIGMLTSAATLEMLARAADSEYVRADVSKHILAINGVKPKAEQTQGAVGGIAFRLVIGGETVDVAALIGPASANAVQSIGAKPESGGLLVVEGEGNYPVEVGSGGRGSS